MSHVVTQDAALLTGPGFAYRATATLPAGTVVRVVAARNGFVQLEMGGWLAASEVAPLVGAPADTVQEATQEVSWSWLSRATGAIQVVGGVMEVALGVGGVVAPEPATTVGGVILIAHGSDTIIAGFRTLWSGEVTHSLTQSGAAAGAEALGASEETAERIGIGVDLAAGIGPSMAMSVSRRMAISAAEHSTETVAVAYLHRSAFQMGHNVVGVRTAGGTTAWVHFAGVPTGSVVPHAGPGARYMITEIAVRAPQAARAVRAQNALMGLGQQTWRFCGPNCTTTAINVLGEAGVVVPAWARSPALLHLGVRAGPEITFFAGAAGAAAPDVVQFGQGLSRPAPLRNPSLSPSVGQE